MTLTEFLLARIAEDEALLAVPTARRMIGRKMVEVPMTRLPEYMVRDRNRWAAECEAKRRILDHLGSDRSGVGDPLHPILRYLALPYADHPDFKPAWRTTLM